MNDLSTILSRPQIITLDTGRKVRCAPLTLDDQADLQAWLDSQQPDAFEAAHREIARGRLEMNGDGKFHRVPYTIEQQKFLLHDALALNSSRRFLLGSQEAAAILQTRDGLKEMTRLALRKGTPDISDGEIDLIFGEVSREIMERIVEIADVMGPTDPKSPRDGTKMDESDPSRSTGGASSVA